MLSRAKTDIWIVSYSRSRFDCQGIYSLRQPGDADAKAETCTWMVMNALDRDQNGELSAQEFIDAAAKNPVIVDIIDGKAK